MAVGERRESSGPELIKRIFVGRSMASGRMEHTLLPKILALPIFASDALSSVAYSVEASLILMVMASSNFRGLLIPINVAVAAVMVIVITSYRQVVRAYPTSAGSYVVSSENLATIFGLVAGAALLTDYVLTVAVSVSSGVLAISSVVNGALGPNIVWVSVGCVVLLTLVNLRGVRESGLAFAVPTYVFILSMFGLIATGIVKCLAGCPQVTGVPHPIPYGPAAAVGVFVILHSFASGSSALTGTEAISNGVSAFRRPQGRNAAQTLTMLGVIAVTMIIGTAFLAYETGARPSRTVSLVSEIAKAVFPGSSPSSGGFMFWVVQISTFAVLILAANTSFQGFPRLAALLARDRFIPSQFENLGDRLVYSNGMIVLSAFAILLIWAFRANVDRLLQLYVVGVFTAFTLSQTGMVRYWRRVSRDGGPKAQGWRWRLTINAVGAVATGIVLVIVIITKFMHGAFIVVAAIPVMIAGFYAVNRHYANVSRQLRAGVVGIQDTLANTVVIYVEDLNAATAQAIGYVRTFRGNEFRAVHVAGTGPADLTERWGEFCRADVALETLPAHGHPTAAVVEYVRSIPRRPQDFVTVVVPEQLTSRSLFATLRRRTTLYLKLRLLSVPGVVIADVPVLAVAESGRGGELKPLMPQRTEAIVFVSAVHDGTVRAINYARSLRATETRAVFVAFEHSEVEKIAAEWDERHIPVQLDIVEAPFRELHVPILQEVRRVTARPDAVAAVVIPEIVVRKWWQQLLHGQRALFIKRLLLFEDRVILSSVPYQLH